MLWAGLLTFGSGLSLVGAFWHERVTSLLLTQIGMISLGVSTVMYAVAVLINVGMGGLMPATIALWFAIATFRRWLQIQREFDAATRKANH
jgi:uncharacterized membrane protein YesL